MQGIGIFTSANGEIKNGEWSKGNFVRQLN